jgi:hypothetical protein
MIAWRTTHGGGQHVSEAPTGRRSRGSGAHPSRWTPVASRPPFAGIVDGTDGGHDGLVSFKTGGPTDGETLITDGDYHENRKGFDAHHDHYGSGDGLNDNGTERGYYTGPGH